MKNYVKAMSRHLPQALVGLPSVLLIVVFLFPSPGLTDDPPTVAPDSGPWQPDRGFTFEKNQKKTRKSMSGIACPPNSAGQHLCLAVFDEGSEARCLVIKDTAYVTRSERIILRPGDIELDAEAAATDGIFYYVTGSHSAKRKDCENNSDSRHVVRFRVDHSTGRPLRSTGDPNGKLVDYADTGRLWTVMASLPALSNYVGDNMCLGTDPPKKGPHTAGKRGVNIEGLAIKGDRLFFGFRGPAVDGKANILAVDAEALFSGGDVHPTVSTIRVGKGQGIRDLHTVSDGILVLAGPDDDAGDKDVGWTVVRWDGKDTGDAVARPKVLARLDLSGVTKRSCDDDLKPEAFAVIDDQPGKSYRMVIFSDGMCDGGPLGFTIRR